MIPLPVNLNPKPVTEKYFGILIPGQLPIFDFDQINDMLVATLANPGNTTFLHYTWNSHHLPPASVSELTFFLNMALPEGVAGTSYSKSRWTQWC